MHAYLTNAIHQLLQRVALTIIYDVHMSSRAIVVHHCHARLAVISALRAAIVGCDGLRVYSMAAS